MTCKSLTQITIPSLITVANDHIVEECLSLKQVSIPNSVISEGNYSFNKCLSITQFIIPPSLKTIDILKSCVSLVQLQFQQSFNSNNHSII